MPIDPGKLRGVVTLQGETAGAKNDRGGYAAPTTSTLGTVRAEIEPLSAHERLIAMQSDSNVTHRVRIRYPEIATPYAVRSFLYNGRTLRVVGPPINEEERNRILRYEVTEAV